MVSSYSVNELIQLFFYNRGDCCIQSVLISILDKDGYFDGCRFQLSNESLLIVQTTTTTMTTDYPSVEPQVRHN